MPGPPRHRSSGPRPRSQERRKPPEEMTGEERRFLNGQLKSGARLRVELTDGSRQQGVVRSFNENTIELDSDERAGLVLRKSQIRLIEEFD